MKNTPAIARPFASPRFFNLVTLAASTLALSSISIADVRPDAHAPISVMGDHIHKKGEFMFSYRYMNMDMDGNRSGTNRMSVDEVLDNYIVSPVDMQMDMHMFGLMYAPTDRLTLMAVGSFIDLSMNHQLRDMVADNLGLGSNQFETQSDGYGDTKIGGIYELSHADGASWLFNLSLSLPTGSIDEKDIIPTLSTTEDSQLPFPMQIGSGTFDLIPGLTYTKLNEDTSWGAQTKVTVRLDENDNGYSKGDNLQAQIWHSWLVSDHVSLSTRLSYDRWTDYEGLDSEQNLPLSNMMGNTVSTINPDLRAGQQAEFAVGINASFGEAGHRIAAEIAKPVWQDLDGPQLETDLTVTLGYQIAF